jgi:uncharacterized membrane protein
MKNKARLLGHPIHPMLVVFPLGLFTTAVVFDVLYLITQNGDFPLVSYYSMAAGLVAGLVAAVFGAVDWFGLPYNSRPWTIGLLHGLGNFLIIGLFTQSWLSRGDNHNFVPELMPLVLSFAGMTLALVTGWMGGELVYRLGVGVDPDAHPDASNSLTKRSGTPSKEKRTG